MYNKVTFRNRLAAISTSNSLLFLHKKSSPFYLIPHCFLPDGEE